MLKKFLKTRRRMYERINKKKTLKGDLFYKIAKVYRFCEENIDTAIKYYEKAAALGDYDSRWELVQLYYYGDEVPQDLLKAEKYFDGITYDAGDGDSIEIEKIVAFAKMYHYSAEGVEKNMVKAVQYYEWLTDVTSYENYEDIVITLAKIYRDGEGVPQNGKRAVELLSELAFSDGYYPGFEYEYPATFAIGSDEARYMLGCMYLYGQGVKKNIYKAAWWFAHIDELNSYDKGDIFKLAEAYRKGDDVEKDVENAIAWYEWLIEYEGDYSGEINYILGRIYFNGDGVEKDIDTAVEYFEKAAENGNEKARYKLWKIERYGAD